MDFVDAGPSGSRLSRRLLLRGSRFKEGDKQRGCSTVYWHIVPRHITPPERGHLSPHGPHREVLYASLYCIPFRGISRK